MNPTAVLLIGYAVFEQVAVGGGVPWLGALALGMLLVAVLLPALRQGRLWAWLLALAGAGCLVSEAGRQWAQAAAFITPVVINTGLALLFGSTLRHGRVPLIARIVRLLHAPEGVPDPAVWDYARQVTVWWVVLFVFNATACLVLALLAEPGGLLALAGVHPPITVAAWLWSFHANVGCYLLVGLLFLIEYTVRCRRFPWQPFRNLFDFLVQVARVSPALAAEMHAERKGSRQSSEPSGRCETSGAAPAARIRHEAGSNDD
jgi:uncharacterized membrane protein